MTDNENSRFKIRLDNEIQDSGFDEEIKNQRIEKLSHRITLVSILIPFLICVILFVAYLDIKKRIAGMYNTGETLSQDLGAKVSALSGKHEKLEKSINKTTASMQKELNEATTAIRYIRSARKIDNKKFNNSIEKIEKKLERAYRDIEAAVSSIKLLDSDFKKELRDFNNELDKVRKELSKLQTDIAALSSSKIDKKILALELKKEQKAFQQKLNKTARDLEDKIISIRNSLKKAKKPASSNPPRLKPASPPKTDAETIPPKAGVIIEQNIKE